MQIKIQNKKGFTLIELLVYIAGLLVLSTVLASLITQFYGLYKEIIAVPRADRTGLLLVDVIGKEIRSATAIDVINSQFNTTNGVLSLIATENQVEIEKRFYVENDRIYLQTNTDDPESLTSSNFVVSNLHFYFVPTDVSQGVRFVIELQYETREGIDTKMYTGFAILRESYE